MNILERINDILTAKNKLVAERPPTSDLVSHQLSQILKFIEKICYFRAKTV